MNQILAQKAIGTMFGIALIVVSIIIAGSFIKFFVENKIRELKKKQANSFPKLSPKTEPRQWIEPETKITKRQPLTQHENKMHRALTDALPECVILAQVAFSALITTESQATRNRFDRKVADFVLCSQQLNVIAIIELDDWSHKGREQQDADRDAMLKNAGYTTVRYARIPTTEKIRSDIEALLTQEANA